MVASGDRAEDAEAMAVSNNGDGVVIVSPAINPW